jgi:hypothetical protein
MAAEAEDEEEGLWPLPVLVGIAEGLEDTGLLGRFLHISKACARAVLLARPPHIIIGHSYNNEAYLRWILDTDRAQAVQYVSWDSYVEWNDYLFELLGQLPNLWKLDMTVEALDDFPSEDGEDGDIEFFEESLRRDITLSQLQHLERFDGYHLYLKSPHPNTLQSVRAWSIESYPQMMPNLQQLDVSQLTHAGLRTVLHIPALQILNVLMLFGLHSGPAIIAPPMEQLVIESIARDEDSDCKLWINLSQVRRFQVEGLMNCAVHEIDLDPRRWLCL